MLKTYKPFIHHFIKYLPGVRTGATAVETGRWDDVVEECGERVEFKVMTLSRALREGTGGGNSRASGPGRKGLWQVGGTKRRPAWLPQGAVVKVE